MRINHSKGIVLSFVRASCTCFLAFFCHSQLQAKTLNGKISDISASRQTMILEIGRVDGVRKGEYGKFYKMLRIKLAPNASTMTGADTSTLTDDEDFESASPVETTKDYRLYVKDPNRWTNHPYVKNAMVAECVKVFDKTSIWRVTNDNVIPDDIQKGEVLQVFERGMNLLGRDKYRKRHRKIYQRDRTDLGDILIEKEIGMPEDMIVRKENLIATDEVSPDPYNQYTDLEVTEVQELKEQNISGIDDYGTIEEDGIGKEVSRNDLFIDDELSDVDNEELESKYNQRLFDRQIEGQENKINGLEYGLIGLYEEERRDENIKELKKNLSAMTTFDQYVAYKKRKIAVDPQAIAKIKNDPELWSSEFNDYELRKYFVRTGILNEIKRRQFALQNRMSNEIFFRFGRNLAPNSPTSEEVDAGFGTTFMVGYEFHLMRATRSMDNWTLQFSLESAVNYYLLDVVNVQSNEFLLSAFVNYYFWNLPSAIDEMAWFVGLGIKNGNSVVSGEELSADYDFLVLTIPSAQIGVKFRFKGGDELDELFKFGFGLQMMASYDVVEMRANEELAENIENSTRVADTKVHVGFSFYF